MKEGDTSSEKFGLVQNPIFDQACFLIQEELGEGMRLLTSKVWMLHHPKGGEQPVLLVLPADPAGPCRGRWDMVLHPLHVLSVWDYACPWAPKEGEAPVYLWVQRPFLTLGLRELCRGEVSVGRNVPCTLSVHPFKGLSQSVPLSPLSVKSFHIIVGPLTKPK